VLIGGLGLFLFGMKNMSEGLQAVAGTRLRRIIGYVTDNRCMAVGAGVAVTCLVQSSSITTVMVVGFVNSGFMVLKQAIGVIFGANIGTTITAWIVTLLPKVGKYGLPLLGVACLVFLFSKRERVRYIGMCAMGLGMVFFGLQLMSDALKPLSQTPEFEGWVKMFEADSFVGVLKGALVGCVLTMLIQSSSATMAVIMNVALVGGISFEAAGALAIGTNIGTTITAYLASLGTNTAAKRAAWAHILFNVAGSAWVLAIYLSLYLPAIKWMVGPNLMLAAVDANGATTYPHVLTGLAILHTVFNVVNTIAFLPFISTLEKIVTRMVPQRVEKETSHLRFLDVRMLDTPALGIEQSHQELVFMGESVGKMMYLLKESIVSDTVNAQREQKLFHREEILDNVQKEITDYLGGLLSGQIPNDVMETARGQLRIADELESISDYATNVLKLLLRLRNSEQEFSQEGKQDVIALHDRVTAYIQMIVHAVREENPDVLSKAISQGEEITFTMKEYREKHLERLSEDKVDTLNSLIYTDMLNAYRRMKDHALNVAEALAGKK